MPSFSTPIVTSQYLIPAVCAGMLFMACFLFLYMYLRTRETLHLSMWFFSLFGAVFVGSEVMILSTGLFMFDPNVGRQFHRIEQLSGACFLFAVPFFTHYIVDLGERWRRANRLLFLAGIILSLVFIAVAFLDPDQFISQSIPKEHWNSIQADYGRGKEGFAYLLRDALIGLVILYTVVCFVADMIRHRRLGYVMLPFIGFLLGIHGAAVDIFYIYTRTYYDPFPFSSHSRFTVGITLMILFCTSTVFRKLFDASHEVKRAEAEAKAEAEKNMRQNRFIREVIERGSLTLVESIEGLSSSIDSFTRQSQEQAAATEEVTASVEQIAAGADHVKANTDEQNRSLELLLATMRDLSKIISGMNDMVSDTRGMVEEISENARSGEQSLAVMAESMITIKKSSQEMTAVIQIINDISDRINLLALNAAIEAARAGEAGRGFAVVADEVSKLADQTTSSIKHISELIKRNEHEITSGNHNVSVAVGKINNIIEGVGRIVERITAISEQMARQTAANSTVNENAEQVKERTQQITSAMTEQKISIEEISKTIGAINELSQSSTNRMMKITDTTKSIVSMVERMHRDIEDFILRSEGTSVDEISGG